MFTLNVTAPNGEIFALSLTDDTDVDALCAPGFEVCEVVDVIEVEYDTSNRIGSVDDIRTIVTAAVDALKCFLAVQPGARRMPDAVVV